MDVTCASNEEGPLEALSLTFSHVNGRKTNRRWFSNRPAFFCPVKLVFFRFQKLAATFLLIVLYFLFVEIKEK
jgi:hypothetical protein